MKLLLPLFLVLILNHQQGYAQYWQPLQNGWKYNYQHDTSSVITTTIWADSSEVISGDTVFYLNRILTDCDTCTGVNGGWFTCSNCYRLRNQPQFMMRSMKQLPGGIYRFADTLIFELSVNNGINDSWMFDAANNISATVLYSGIQTVFGSNDSVKTVLLSTIDTILLSGNHGILQFPDFRMPGYYYRLAGIEGPGLGLHVPDFWDFFNLNIGDVLGFTGHYLNGQSPGWGYCDWTRLITITDKWIYTDSVKFRVQGYLQQTCVPPLIIQTIPIDDTLTYMDSTGHFINLYPQTITTVTAIGNQKDASIQALGVPIYDNVILYRDSNNVQIKKTSGFSGSSSPAYIPSTNCFEILPGFDVLNRIDITNSFQSWANVQYRVGLGITDMEFFGFEIIFYEYLRGYVKNGDTVGVITSVPEFQNLNGVLLFPNPASDYFTVKLSDSSPAKGIIYDVTGKEYIQFNIDSNQQISVAELPQGVFLLKIITGHSSVFRKLIITR